MEKAVYEIDYEVNNRPDWVIIPIRGVKTLLKKDQRLKVMTASVQSAKAVAT
jgi:maltose alpha-D-glucosyltransferase/alpha-amylase